MCADKQLADNSKAEKVKPVLKLMSLIGTLTGGRSVTQVALNYLMQKGEPPIATGRLQQAAGLQAGLGDGPV